MEPSKGPGVGTLDGIDEGARLDEGSCVRMDDGPQLAEGLADETDNVSADGKLLQVSRSCSACQRGHRK